MITHVDGRFWSTLWLLLVRPGQLTLEYFAERRARFVPPVRLYLVISIVFFGLASLTSGLRADVTVTDPDVRRQVATDLDTIKREARAAQREARAAAAPAAAPAAGDAARNAGFDDVEQGAGDVSFAFDVRNAAMPVGANRLHQGLAGRSGDWLFARRVHVGDEKDVGLVERAREIVEEELGARVPVGLEGDDDAPVESALGCIEGRLDLGGVVAVVIDDDDVAGLAVFREERLAQDREVALNSVEPRDGLPRHVEGHFELVGDGDDGERVEHVVRPGHAHDEPPERLVATKRVEISVPTAETTAFGSARSTSYERESRRASTRGPEASALACA